MEKERSLETENINLSDSALSVLWGKKKENENIIYKPALPGACDSHDWASKRIDCARMSCGLSITT